MPEFAQAFFQTIGFQWQRGQERRMAAILTIRRLPFGDREQLFHETYVRIQQEGPMEKQSRSFSPLGIAGNLAIVQGQVGFTLNADRPTQKGFQKELVTLEDVGIGSVDGGQARISRDG